MKYKIYPDIATFGKALGNGYAITAVIGKDDIMKNAADSFISSTFWTERIGPTAALKTLEIMEKNKTWQIISRKGKYIQKQWKKLAKESNLEVSINGLPAICSFQLNLERWPTYKTFISQEMLKKNILASNILYLSISHSEKQIDFYLSQLRIIFEKISEFEKQKTNLEDFLDGPIAQQGFKRLN